MKSSQGVITEQLQQAQDDLDALLPCFVSDVQGDHPRYPDRAFQGLEPVYKNWSLIFQDILDVQAELLRSAVVGGTT